MSLYRWLASIVLTLVLLVPMLAVGLIASETGSRWLLEQVQKYLPAPVEIHYSEFHGTLLNEFRFDDFILESESLSYSPRQLKIEWQPIALLSGVLRIEKIKSIGGEVRVRASLEDNQNSGTSTSIKDIKIELPLTLDLRDVTVQKSQFFILNAPPQQLSIDTSVKVNTHGQLNIRAFRLKHQYLTTTISGTTKLSYPFESEIKNNTKLHSPDYPFLEIQSQVSGDIQDITTSSNFSEGLNGKVTAKIEKPLDMLSWQFDSQWQENNLDQWLESLGVDNIELSFSGNLEGQGSLTQASLEPKVSITLNQQDADIDGNIHYQDNTLYLDPLNVYSEDEIQGQLALKGSISSLNTKPTVDASISWDEVTYRPNSIISRNGKLLLQGALDNLSLSLNNELSGILEQQFALTTEAKLKPESLKISTLTLSQNNEKVSGNALIKWEKGVAIIADMSGNYQQEPVSTTVKLRILAPYLFVDRFEASWGAQSIQADGALSPGEKVKWQLNSGNLNAISGIKGEVMTKGSISGQLNQPEFGFGIDKFTLKHPDYNAVILSKPVTGRFNYQSIAFNLTPVCLVYSGVNSPLCLQAKQNGEVINFDASAREVPLNLIQALALPAAPYKLNGLLSLDIKGSYNYQNMELASINGTINADNSQLQAVDQTITLNQLSLTAKDRNEGGVSIALTADARELDFNLTGQLAIKEMEVNSPITGEVSLTSDSLELLNLLMPQLNIGNGAISAQLNIGGSLDDPGASGRVNFSADRVVILSSGTLITDLEAELTADANAGQFEVNGNAQVGPGDVKVEGRFDAFEQKGLLTINGNDLLILDTPDLLVVTSPDLAIELDKDLITVTGDLHVPKARITPVELNQAVTPSADVVLKNEPKKETPFSTKADITVSLGKDVKVEALGFSGNLQGKLQITQQPGSVPRGNGTIGVVSGNYEIYGQKLAIERGDLIFNGGPLDTPTLNLRITRKIAQNGVNQSPPETVGARVTGSIERPELSLFSTPPLPDSTILSYLLFGKPPGSQGDANNLELQAALLVGGRGTEFLTDSIKSTFNLDEVSLDSETSDINDTSLYIGKYLSPRLYVKYGIGLLEPTSTFILRYTLSENLIFESTSTTESQSGDLIYTIEN